MQVSVLWNKSIVFSSRAELLMFTTFECVFECKDLRKRAQRGWRCDGPAPPVNPAPLQLPVHLLPP